MRNFGFDVWVAVLSGAAGYGLIRLGVPILPLAFGVVLGPILEENLRRTLMIHGDWTIFLSRPISLTLVTISIAVLCGPMLVDAGTAMLRRSSDNAR